MKKVEGVICRHRILPGSIETWDEECNFCIKCFSLYWFNELESGVKNLLLLKAEIIIRIV